MTAADDIWMKYGAPKMSRYLPQALLATAVVVAAPVVAVWALRAGRVVDSTAVAVLIGVALSMAVSFAGSTYWASSDSSRDVLFSELMIWGWLRRWRAEHQLDAALAGLAGRTAPEQAAAATGQLSMLKELAEALEAGDPYTRGHSRRVARYATMVAERLGLPAEDVDRIRTAAAVHDVGKVRTPIEVLHKPGRLTDEEYAVIKAHPVDGARLVEALGDDHITAIVRHHHERLDGRGYPNGLSGEEIPLGARIVAVADTFDAITSARPYRSASPHRKALDILIKEAGTQLDAEAVRAFRACYTGRRPFALWMTLLAFPQRLSTSLGNGTTATAVSISKAVVAASTVAVVGGAAASAPPLLPSAPARTAAPAMASAPAASSSAPSASPSAAPATLAAAPALVGTAAPASAGASFSTAAAAREHSALRRLPTLDRSFPHTARHPHAVTAPTRHAPVARPAQSVATTVAAAPGTPSQVSAPVSTTAAAPTAVPVADPRPAPAPAGSDKGKGKGKGHGKGSAASPGKSSGGPNGNGNAKGHGKGDGSSATGKGGGNGAGKGNGSGTPSDAGKGNGPANSNDNGSPNGNGNSPANGNGKGDASGPTSGNGKGSGKGDTSGPAGGSGNANGSAAATGSGNGDAGSGTGGSGNGDAGSGTSGGGNGHAGGGNGKGNSGENAGGGSKVHGADARADGAGARIYASIISRSCAAASRNSREICICEQPNRSAISDWIRFSLSRIASAWRCQDDSVGMAAARDNEVSTSA